MWEKAIRSYTVSGTYTVDNKTYSQKPNVANIDKDIQKHLGVGMTKKECQEDLKLASKNFFYKMCLRY